MTSKVCCQKFLGGLTEHPDISKLKKCPFFKPFRLKMAPHRAQEGRNFCQKIVSFIFSEKQIVSNRYSSVQKKKRVKPFRENLLNLLITWRSNRQTSNCQTSLWRHPTPTDSTKTTNETLLLLFTVVLLLFYTRSVFFFLLFVCYVFYMRRLSILSVFVVFLDFYSFFYWFWVFFRFQLVHFATFSVSEVSTRRRSLLRSYMLTFSDF